YPLYRLLACLASPPHTVCTSPGTSYRHCRAYRTSPNRSASSSPQASSYHPANCLSTNRNGSATPLFRRSNDWSSHLLGRHIPTPLPSATDNPSTSSSSPSTWSPVHSWSRSTTDLRGFSLAY